MCRHDVAIRMPNGVMYVNIMTTGSAPLASFLTVEEGIVLYRLAARCVTEALYT